MAAKSSSTGPVIIAVIGVVGTIAAAAIANWDKLFGDRKVDQPRLEQPSSDAGTQPSEENVTAAAAPKDMGMDAAAPINIAGKWTDAAGYEYIYEQKGNQYFFNQYKNGEHLTYGAGSCSGEISEDLNHADSTCTIGANSFPLRVTRSAAAKS